MKRIKIVVYHRYEALSIPKKQRVKYFINLLFIKRYFIAKLTKNAYAKIAPNPGFVIPRSKGVAKIDFYNKDLVNKAVAEANKILENHKNKKDSVIASKS